MYVSLLNNGVGHRENKTGLSAVIDILCIRLIFWLLVPGSQEWRHYHLIAAQNNEYPLLTRTQSVYLCTK